MVKKRSLTQNVDIMTNRGARVSHIKRKLQQTDISKYRVIIVQAGGNDIAEGRHEEAIENDFVNLIRYVKTESPETTVYISEITPRRDAGVTEINSYIKFLYKDNGDICIPISGRIELNSFKIIQERPIIR